MLVAKKMSFKVIVQLVLKDKWGCFWFSLVARNEVVKG
jgi:hypothetical protein